MESGADDVFLSSDVDLDVRLKVCAAKLTVFILGMRKLKKNFTRSPSSSLPLPNFAGY